MTTLRRERRLGLASFLLLLAAGLIAMLLGPPLSAPQQRQATLALGAALVAGALAMGGVSFWTSRRRRAEYRLAARYKCPRCGAAPPPAEEHTAACAHCSLCGQAVVTVEDQRFACAHHHAAQVA